MMKKIIAGLFIFLLTFTISCSIVMKESGMSDSASSQYIIWSHSSAKTIFSVNDEKATYWVQLENNFVGSYKRFDIEWITPDGKPFIKSKMSTVFGRNDRIIAMLPIKDNTPSKMPGNWTVRLSLDGQLIGQENFTIEDPNKINSVQHSAPKGEEVKSQTKETIKSESEQKPNNDSQTKNDTAKSPPSNTKSGSIEEDLRKIMTQ